MRFSPGCSCCASPASPIGCDVCTSTIPSELGLSIVYLGTSASPCCDQTEARICLLLTSECIWTTNITDRCNLPDTLQVTLELLPDAGTIYVIVDIEDANGDGERYRADVGSGTMMDCNDLDQIVIPYEKALGNGLSDCDWSAAHIVLHADCNVASDEIQCGLCDGGDGPNLFLVEIEGMTNGTCINSIGPPTAVTGCPDYDGTYVVEFSNDTGTLCNWLSTIEFQKHTPNEKVFGSCSTDTTNTFSVEFQIQDIGPDIRMKVILNLPTPGIGGGSSDVVWQRDFTGVSTIDCNVIERELPFLSGGNAESCIASGATATVWQISA
jgi:hypothetical protein